jgi:hypothetical protein
VNLDETTTKSEEALLEINCRNCTVMPIDEFIGYCSEPHLSFNRTRPSRPVLSRTEKSRGPHDHCPLGPL